MTPVRPGSGIAGRVSLAFGASASVAAAVLLDILAGEHPTHTLGLALVALVVAGVRLYTGIATRSCSRLGQRYRAVSGA